MAPDAQITPKGLWMHGVEVIMLLLFALAGVAVGFVILDLFVSGLVLAALKRKRHLVWALPPVNWGVYLLLFPWGYNAVASEPIAFGEQFGSDFVLLHVVACGLLTGLGWGSAMLLLPMRLLVRAVRYATDDSGPASEKSKRFFDDYLARPATSSISGGFVEGLSAPWHGLVYLCVYPRLWRHAIVPVVLNLVITAVALLLFLTAVTAGGTSLHSMFPEGIGWLLLEILCGIFLLLLALGATLVTWLLMQEVLCGHFYEKLAREVEIRLGMRAEDLEGLSITTDIADTAADLRTLAGVNAGFLALHLIPVVGSIAGIAGSLYVNCYNFGTAYLAYPLALRGQGRRQRRETTRRFRSQTLGLGAVVLLVNLVPLVSSLVLTTAVVGAVLLNRRLEASEPEQIEHAEQ